MHACVRACVCMRACVRVCVCVCVCACVRVCAWFKLSHTIPFGFILSFAVAGRCFIIVKQQQSPEQSKGFVQISACLPACLPACKKRGRQACLLIGLSETT